MRRRIRVSVMGAVFFLVTAGLADAARHAQPCHPDLAGTRSLTVTGAVTGYAFEGGRVVVDWARSECAGTVAWDYASTPRGRASAACQRPGGLHSRGAGTRLSAAQGDRIVRVALAPAWADRPDRLVVLDRTTHRRLASWPLVDRPARVALRGGTAILSAANRHALYALRISDGRIAMVGITRAGDRPLIGRAGVLYQDDLDVSKHRSAPQEVTLKLLPLATVGRELAKVGRQIKTSPISAISMDGPRVAFAVRDPQGKCDRVLFWNIPWRSVSQLTQRSGPTCLPSHARGGITDVAIAGSRAMWTTDYGGTTRVLAASIVKCIEWVVARPVAGVQRVAGLSGDGGVLAYALGRRRAAARGPVSVGIVPGAWRGIEIERSDGQIDAVSSDGGRVAALHGDGTVTVVTRGGRTIDRVVVGRARAIALRAGTLAVLSARGRLDVYRTSSGRRVHSWRVPAGATSVDLHYGIALVTSGLDVDAVNVATGRATRLLHAPGRVSAELESPGAAIQFNAGGHGYLRFVPMSRIQARTS